LAGASGYAAGKLYDAPKAVRAAAKNSLLKEAAIQAKNVLRPPMSDAFQATFPEAMLGKVKLKATNPTKLFRRYSKIQKYASYLPKIAPYVFLAGTGLGAALVARGIAKTRREKNPTLKTALAQDIGGAAAFGLGGVSLLRTRGVGLKEAVKEVIHITPKYLKKFKR
jgi:hypothetical protein